MAQTYQVIGNHQQPVSNPVDGETALGIMLELEKRQIITTAFAGLLYGEPCYLTIDEMKDIWGAIFK